MSDYDQGAYTPPGERLAFDPREPVRSGPAPVTLIASGLILLGLVGGVAFVYRHGFRHAGAAPAEVGAPIAQIKTPAPSDAAGSAPAGLSVEKTSAAPTFAPAPEQPAPRGPAVSVAPLPAPPAAAPVAATAAPPAAKPVTIASLTDAAMAPKPAPSKPALMPASNPASASLAAAGANWVQIGAFSSTALAEKGWSDIAAAAPGDMKGKGRKVESVAAGGKTLYRAYVTGFASHAAAETFCGDLKAIGRSCIVK